MPSPTRRTRRYIRERSYPPERAFKHAVMLLNRTNVTDAWKLSCRLSLHEAYTGYNDPTFVLPILNAEKVRLFDQAIIASTAGDQWKDELNEADLRNVLDDCTDAHHDPKDAKRLARFSGTERADLEFERFLAKVGNVQFPQQEPRPEVRLGRAIAMFEVLPEEHRDLISPTQLRDVSSCESPTS